MVFKCKKCGKLFDYRIVGTIYPGGKEREYIDCPYCGKTNGSEMTSAFIQTYKIDKNNTREQINPHIFQ